MPSTPALDNPSATDSVPLGKALVEWTGTERVAATERLIAEHHADVYRYARWLTRCPTAAEDIAQEVFLQAFRGIHNLRDPASGRSWLLTITRNECARWSKKSQPMGSHVLVEDEVSLEENQHRLEDIEWVAAGIRELHEDYRVVVLLYYFERLTYAEIAEQLSIPIGTVMSRLSRGRSQLKECLQRAVT